MINTPFWRKPNVLAKTFFGSVRRVFIHFIKYQQVLTNQSNEKGLVYDLVAACELAFSWGLLIKSVLFY
jgi:hypothetical protein